MRKSVEDSHALLVRFQALHAMNFHRDGPGRSPLSDRDRSEYTRAFRSGLAYREEGIDSSAVVVDGVRHMRNNMRCRDHMGTPQRSE